MSRTEHYIATVTNSVRDKKAAVAIRRELEEHLFDRTQYYMAAGYPADEAEQLAISRMGKPEEVGKAMRRLHPSDSASKASVLLSVVTVLCVVSWLTAAILLFQTEGLISEAANLLLFYALFLLPRTVMITAPVCV